MTLALRFCLVIAGIATAVNAVVEFKQKLTIRKSRSTRLDALKEGPKIFRKVLPVPSLDYQGLGASGTHILKLDLAMRPRLSRACIHEKLIHRGLILSQHR